MMIANVRRRTPWILFVLLAAIPGSAACQRSRRSHPEPADPALACQAHDGAAPVETPDRTPRDAAPPPGEPDFDPPRLGRALGKGEYEPEPLPGLPAGFPIALYPGASVRRITGVDLPSGRIIRVEVGGSGASYDAVARHYEAQLRGIPEVSFSRTDNEPRPDGSRDSGIHAAVLGRFRVSIHLLGGANGTVTAHVDWTRLSRAMRERIRKEAPHLVRPE